MSSMFYQISVMAVLAGLLSWLFARFRQPVILAYFAGGVLAGPVGFDLVHTVEAFDTLGHLGVTLLLFLAGMVLHPDRLVRLFRSTLVLTVGSSLVFWLVTFGVLILFRVPPGAAAVGGLAGMFSSTILVVKLLPTTTLHQRHMGSVCIAVLILQDLLAVGCLVFLEGFGSTSWVTFLFGLPLAALLLGAGAWLLEEHVLRKMMRQADTYHEVLYMLCLSWCLGMALLAGRFGLSHEVGAFMAGVALARNPASRFVAEQFKPLRDFCLMFFFFILGVELEPATLRSVWLPALVLGVVLLAMKPPVLRLLLRKTGETAAFAGEVGLRLGQGSEFGLIVVTAAIGRGLLDAPTGHMVQLAILFSMLISSYLVVFRCPTPLGTRQALKQD